MDTPQIPYMEIAAGVATGLWLISEALAGIPAVKANSVFQAVHNFLAKFKGKPAE